MPSLLTLGAGSTPASQAAQLVKLLGDLNFREQAVQALTSLAEVDETCKVEIANAGAA